MLFRSSNLVHIKSFLALLVGIIAHISDACIFSGSNTMVKTQAADGTILETVWESRWLPDSHGGIAQLGEHLPCKQGVKGSNPFISTQQVKLVEICSLKTEY